MTSQTTTGMPPVEVFAFAAVVRDWACSVDGRFTTLNGDIFCGNADHERSGLNSGRLFMSDLMLWISEHWECVERVSDAAGEVAQPTLPEPTADPAMVRPYIYAAGAPAVGVAQVPGSVEWPGITPHPFVESGPGQEPATVKGCIVCPDCLQPKRAPIHTAAVREQVAIDWAADAADKAVSGAASQLVVEQLGTFANDALARIGNTAFQRTYDAVMAGTLPAAESVITDALNDADGGAQ